MTRALARLALLLDLPPARVTRINIALCFPELDAAAQRSLACESLAETTQLVFEIGDLYAGPLTALDAAADSASALAPLEAALAEGRGVLLLVPHFGNWEYLSVLLGRYALTALYEPGHHPRLGEIIRQGRSRGGAVLVPTGSTGLRAVYRTLKAGGLAGILPDQVPAAVAGRYAPFFGRPALTMTLAHRLLLRTGAVPMLAGARRGSGCFELSFTQLPEVAQPDEARALAAMNAAIEALVRSAPAQYQWEYRRFRRPPAGHPQPYRARRPLR